jgi:hypothetical protein
MIGINLENDAPVYSLAVGNKAPAPEDRDLRTQQDLLDRLKDLLDRTPGRVEVNINAHKDVKSGVVRDLTAKLSEPEYRRHIQDKYFGVSQKAP